MNASHLTPNRRSRSIQKCCTHCQNCICSDVEPLHTTDKKPSLYYDIFPEIAALMTTAVRLSTDKFGASCSFCAYSRKVDVYVFPQGPLCPSEMTTLGSVVIDQKDLKGTKQALRDLQIRLLRANGATL